MSHTFTDLELINMGLNRAEWQTIKNLAAMATKTSDQLCTWYGNLSPVLCLRKSLPSWSRLSVR